MKQLKRCLSLLLRDLNELVDDNLKASPHLLTTRDDLVGRQYKSVHKTLIIKSYNLSSYSSVSMLSSDASQWGGLSGQHLLQKK